MLENQAEYILSQINRIAKVGVKSKIVTLDNFDYTPTFKYHDYTVASLRLDAVVAAITGLSREKVRTLMLSGNVFKNYIEDTNISDKVSQDDIISIRKYGKFILDDINGLTKKGRQKIDEIKDVKFRTNRGGSFYKAEDVDSFIDDVIETFEQKNNEKAELVHKMDILATRIEQYRSDEETVRNALLSAQKVADSTLKEANEQSEIAVKNAEKKADELIAQAQAEVKKEKDSLVALQKLANEMRTELLMKVKSCIDIVDALPTDNVVAEIQEKLSKDFPTPAVAEEVVEPKAEPVKVAEPPVEVEKKEPAEEIKEEKKTDPALEGTTKFGVLKFGSNYDVEE